MKKIFAALLAGTLLLASASYAASGANDLLGTAYERSAYDLMALGIMQGYEDQTFRPFDEVTRAEMTAITVRMLGLEGVTMGLTDYSDVAEEHWASAYIGLSTSLGIISGYGDGSFRPEDNVTYEQAIKMLVCALGYKDIAEQEGGYPVGYWMIAFRLGITKGIGAEGTKPAIRGDIALFVTNAFDCKPLVMLSGGDGRVLKTYTEDQTLHERLMSKHGMIKISGQVTENEVTSLTGESTLNAGEVKIGGEVLKSGDMKAEHYLGMTLDVYAQKAEEEDIPVIITINPLKKGVNELNIKAEEIISVFADVIRYSSGAASKTAVIDTVNASYLYNGKAITKDEAISDDMNVFNGNYRLLDVDGNGQFDIIFIEERESFIVDRISQINHTLYFASDMKYRGKSGFKFFFEEDDYKYKICDHQGNEIDFTDIKEGSAVTLVASMDLKHVAVSVSEEKINGSVTETNSTTGDVVINNRTYAVTKTASGEVNTDLKIGDEGTFVLDSFGSIVGVLDSIRSGENYGYVVDAGITGSGLSRGPMLKLILSGAKNKNIQIKNDAETITYNLQNSQMAFHRLADRIILNGVSTVKNQVNIEQLKGMVVRYSLDAEENIKVIQSFEGQWVEKRPYNCNIRLLSFAGFIGYDGFFLGEKTKLICIPNTYDSDNDFFETVVLADASNYTMVPIGIDAKTQIASAVLLYSDMDAEAPRPIPADTKVSIVGRISVVLDDDGGMIYKIDVLTGEDSSFEETKSSDDINDIASTLRNGDLIKYTLDGFGKINAIEKLGSTQDLDIYFREGQNSPKETVYGIVRSIEQNRLSNIRNEVVDIIEVMFSDDGDGMIAKYEFITEDGPTVYKYEKSTGRIFRATTEDILGYVDVGADASKVFIVANNNDPMILVIVV